MDIEEKKKIGEVYKACYADIFRFLASRISNTSDAEETAQEVFLALIRKWEELECGSMAEYKAWLYGVADNMMKKYFRTKKRHPVEIGYDDDSYNAALQYIEEFSDGSRERDLGIGNEKTEEFVKASLKEKDREFFELAFVKKVTNRELEEHFGQRSDVIRVRKSRIKSLITELIKKYFG